MPNSLLLSLLSLILLILGFSAGAATHDLVTTHNRVRSAMPTCTLNGPYYVCYDIVPADTLGEPYLASDSLGTRIRRK